MSEKKRRDITLGEMQDECKGHVFCSECKYSKICTYDRQVSMNEIDLNDPPRFNEQQMELLKALYANGGKKIVHTGNGCFNLERSEESYDAFLGVIKLKDGETLDLAELIGKDGE